MPGLRFKMCWGKPFGFSVFRYSVLNLKASSGFSRVSALSSLTPAFGNQSWITSLRASTSLFVGARNVRPSNHPGDHLLWNKDTSIQIYTVSNA